MTGHTPMKMKRKELEEVYDDFSEFSLSSPARKIRRLDAELPPIIEEEDVGVPFEVDVPVPDGVIETTPSLPVADGALESTPSFPLNEERALVLYKPVNASFSMLPNSDVSLTVNTDFLSGFKNHAFWSDRSNLRKRLEEKADSSDESYDTNGCMAVVPWVSQQLPTISEMDLSVSELSEPVEAMESDDMENGTMEIEVEGMPEEQAGKTPVLGDGDAFQRWQQQHCLTPQIPQNTATPVMWSW